LKHGIGKLIYPNGCEFIGKFENDKKSGKGLLNCKPGRSLIGVNFYDGHYKNDLMDGFGIVRLSTGNTYTGQFKEGRIIKRTQLMKRIN